MCATVLTVGLNSTVISSSLITEEKGAFVATCTFCYILFEKELFYFKGISVPGTICYFNRNVKSVSSKKYDTTLTLRYTNKLNTFHFKNTY